MRKFTRNTPNLEIRCKCLFCGDDCDIAMDKRKAVWEVRILHLKKKISDFALQRKDEWGEKVLQRVNSVICLVAEKARYHEVCNTKFFCTTSSCLKRGRPKDEHIESAFENLCTYIDESEECQFILHDLMRVLERYMPETSSVTEKTLKTKLMATYGDQVLFF